MAAILQRTNSAPDKRLDCRHFVSIDPQAIYWKRRASGLWRVGARMNLVRLMVRPHLLEQVFESLEPFDVDALTVRQVRGERAESRIFGFSGGFDTVGQVWPMHAEIDFFIDESQSESLLETLRLKMACGSSDDCRIFCLSCHAIELAETTLLTQKAST
ncbi:MAG: hypothetical protein ACKO0V_04355 [bacterium]